MTEITINVNDVGIRIDNFLLKMDLGLSKPHIYKLIRNKKIKVNDKKIDFNYRLKLNDVIKIYYNLQTNEMKNFEFLDAKLLTDIIYEDMNIIIVNKPVGLLCHEDNSKKNNDTLINRIKKYLYDKNEYKLDKENQFSPSLAHRIDRNTSGLVVAAKNHDALVSLTKLFKYHSLNKHYLALVHGIIKNNDDKLELFIKDNNNGFVSVSNKEQDGYKKAITHYYLKQIIKNKYSLVDVCLITGRKHQIRASFNFINHPLVGEQKYITKNIDKNTKFKYQCLVAYKLEFKIYDKNDCLFYLNNKEFITDKIWFLDFI